MFYNAILYLERTNCRLQPYLCYRREVINFYSINWIYRYERSVILNHSSCTQWILKIQKNTVIYKIIETKLINNKIRMYFLENSQRNVKLNKFSHTNNCRVFHPRGRSPKPGRPHAHPKSRPVPPFPHRASSKIT